MKKQFKGFVIGVLVTLILTSTIAFAGGVKQKIDVMLNSINLTVNGKAVKADNILYKGTTYVPIRAVGEMLGKDVTWDAKTNTAGINDKGFKPSQSDNSQKDKTTNDGKNMYVNLSEKDIQSAINEGKNGVMTISSYARENYNLKFISGIDSLIDNAQINTPYLSIAYSSALKSSKYEEVTKEDINRLLKEYEYMQPFSVTMYGSSIDFPQHTHMVLKQGNKVIQPSKIYGTDSFADRSTKWPNFPAYQATIGAEFPSKEIDYSKKAELIVIWASDMEFVFEVDFSEYK